MTPTPEDIALAERIASEQDWDTSPSRACYNAALTAIMEVRQCVERELDKCCDPCPQCHDAIRNGEYLK